MWLVGGEGEEDSLHWTDTGPSSSCGRREDGGGRERDGGGGGEGGEGGEGGSSDI